MGLFKIFKKSEVVPPDLGSEGSDVSLILNKKSKKNGKVNLPVADVQIEELKAKIEMLEKLIKEFSERFSKVNQGLGEVRQSTFSNEKSVGIAEKNSEMAINFVKEMQPEKLTLYLKRFNSQVDVINERLGANRKFYQFLEEEILKLKKKSDSFIGAEALLKLNKELTKDMVELRKTNRIVKANADRAEQIFIDSKREILESQKSSQMITDLDSSYSSLRKELETLRLDYSRVVSTKDFSDFRNSFERRLSIVENYFSTFEEIKSENKRMLKLVESTVSVSEENKQNIEKIARIVGEKNVPVPIDYNSKLNSLLSVIDSLADQLSTIKKKLNIKENEKKAL